MSRTRIRERSIARLRSYGVEIPMHLPLLEEESVLSPKGIDDVTGKIAALGFVVGLGYTDKSAKLIDGINSNGLWPYVSPNEASCLRNPASLSPVQRGEFKWLAECIHALAWCLSITTLDPAKGCPDNLAALTVPGHSPSDFRMNKYLRPKNELQEEADFYFCLHWYEVQAALDSRRGLLGETRARQRRRALDWVIGVSDDWDNMPLDT